MTDATPGTHPPALDKNELIARHAKAANWYWDKSRINKKWYKWSRYLVIVLGALVTLIASLSSADFIAQSPGWDRTFAIATPLLAALLAIITGLSQTFQWGAAWREMVLTAELIEKHRDRIWATPDAEIDLSAELAHLNDLVLEESQQFFERVTGATTVKKVIVGGAAPDTASPGEGGEGPPG